MKKRVLSLFMALTMCLTLLPTAAWAEGEDAGDGATTGAVAEVTIDGTTTQYDDIDTAFAAAVGDVGSTLKLLADVETGSAYTVESGSHTLDLNGKKLTSTNTGDGFLYINGGTLTIQDGGTGGGAIKSVHSTLRVNNGGSLTVTGGSFTSAGNNALIVFEDGSAQLSGGSFSTTNQNEAHSIWVANGKAADLLVSGYRYMKTDDLTQKSFYHTDGNGVVGATTVCEIPEGEVTYTDADGNEQTQEGCTEITADTDNLTDGWYVVNKNVTGSYNFVSGTVNLILCDGAEWSMSSGGLYMGKDAVLNIYAQSAGTGKLTATGMGTKPAIGMDTGMSGGTLNIYGGVITATSRIDTSTGLGEVSASEKRGAAIGTCGGSNSSMTVNIKGGTVTAKATYGTAAIGPGQDSAGTVGVSFSGMKCVQTDKPNEPYMENIGYTNVYGVSVTITKCVDHKWSYTQNSDGDEHTLTCALCGEDGGTAPHSFDTYVSNDDNGHTYACVCGKESTEAHTLSYVITSTTHKQECGLCGYETTPEAHKFGGENGNCSVCGADKDIAVEKVAVAITDPITGTVTTTNYTDLIEAFKAADEGQATKVEVSLLQNGKTYTLDSAELYPIEFEYTSGVEVIVDLNGCTLKRSVPNSGYGILKVEKGNVTLKNGTLELDDSLSAQAIELLATGNKPTLTLENMTVKAAQGNAIDAENGTLYIRSGIYGKVLINDNLDLAEAQLSGGSYDSVICYSNGYANLLETGYIFVKQTDNSYIDPSTMSSENDNIKNIKVIECEHKDASGASLFESGKCKQCGLTCTKHEFSSGSVCKNCGRALVVQDGTNFYVSLNEAFANVANNSEILVLTDLPEETLTFNCADKDVTLELCNQPVNGSADNAATLTVEGGKLTVINGSEYSIEEVKNGPAVITNSGKGFAVSVTGGTLAFGGKATLTGGLQVIKGGKLAGGLKVGTILIAGTGNAMDGESASSVSVRDSVGNQNYGVVRDLLGEGLAFAEYDKDTGKTGEIIRGNEVALTEDVIVVAHTQHDYTGGECACGAVCPHETVGTDGKCSVCGTQMVAQAGGKYYTTLTDAISGADGAEITLIAAFQESVTVTNKATAVINLGGQKYWTATDGNPALTINGGKVTLRNGALAQDGTGDESNAIYMTNGELIVENSVTEIDAVPNNSSLHYAIYANGGTLTLQGNTLLTGGLDVTNNVTVKSGSNGEITGLTAGVFTKNKDNSSSVRRTGDSNTTPFVLLAEGYAFAKYDKTKGTYGDFLTADDLNSNSTGIFYDVTVVRCTHKNGDTSLIEMNGSTGTCKACGYTCSAHEFENGVCKNCGYACPHEQVTETGLEGHKTASCDTCGQPMAVKVKSGGTTTYYAQMHYTYKGVDYDNTLKTILNGAGGTTNGYAENGSTITLLTDGLNANAVVNNSRSITLDLNGKKLIETDGIRVDPGSTLTVTGEGSSSEDDNSRLPCVFNVQGGTLVFKEFYFGGTFNVIRVGSGTLTSARDTEDAVIIGTLEIGDANAKVSFKQGTFGKIVFDVNSGSVTLGNLLGMWKDAEDNDVRSGNAFRYVDEDGNLGDYVPYSTEITKDKPIENIKLVGCPHDSVTSGTCDYCLTAHLVAARINPHGSMATYAAKSGNEDDIKQSIIYALTGWGKSHGGTLKLFRDISLDGIQFEEGSEAGSITITYAYADGIDLNGHTITGGTLTLDKNESGKGTNVTITDNSANKGSVSTPITVNGGATLTVDGVSVGKITAAAADAKITLKAGTKFTDYSRPQGMILADWIEDRYYVKNGDSYAQLADNTGTAGGPGTYEVVKVPAAITAGSKSGDIRYGEKVPASFLPTIDPTGTAPDSYSVIWYYKKNDELCSLGMGTLRGTSFEFNQSRASFSGVAIGDTLDVFCIIRAMDSSEKTLWQTVVTGYTLTVTKGQAAVKKAPTAAADLTYTGSAQNLLAEGTATGGTMQYSLEQNGTYSATVPTGTDAKEYTVWYKVVGDSNHEDSQPQSVKVTIAPKEVTSLIIDVEYGSTYNGEERKPNVTVKDENGTEIPASEYEVTYSNNINAGENTAAVTITNKDGGNYIVNGSAKFTIHKAIASGWQSGTLKIANNHAATYTYDVSQLLPTLESGREYGTVTYTCVWNATDSSYTVTPSIDEHGILSLHVTAPNVNDEKPVGSVKVTVTSTNYLDFDLTVSVNAVNKLVPTGEPTLSKTTLTYGEKLGEITLSGAMQDGANTVAGTFTWTNPDEVLNAGDAVSVTWKFTPTDDLKYMEVTDTVTITVNKATPTGAPKYTAITTSGKKLSDAALTTEGGTFSVPGTVVWELAADTEVTANTAYKWVFTPTDRDNYNEISDSVTLYSVSTGGGGGGGGSTTTSTETTTNPDGSTTKTETKSDGTVIETTTNKDGSSTKTESKTETKSDGSTVETVTETRTEADGSKTTGKTETVTAKDGTKTETKSETSTAKDGTKTETKSEIKTDANGVTNGTETSKSTAANGSTGTTTTVIENGVSKTEAEAKISDKAVSDAKKSDEAVKIPTEVKAGGDSASAPTVKIDLPKNSGETKIEIPVKDVSAGTVAVIVHPDGTEELIKESLPTEGGVQLTVDGSVTVKIVDNAKDFKDTKNHWAADSFDFVSARGLVNGTGGDSFDPNAASTRAQLWTILARQSGTDLTGGASWYEKAQEWAKANGISDGSNPDSSITRAQMVTMLWRAAGSPKADGANAFNDVPAGSYYADAIAWAAAHGITTGVGNGAFDPNGTCTRAQIAAFLHRSYLSE